MKKPGYLLISLFLILMLALQSCTPQISTSLIKHYDPLGYNSIIRVIELNDSLPVHSEILGTIRIGDSGFTTQCDYATVLEAAKNEARKAGGNAIKIIVHKLPNMVSTCHQITAQIVKIYDGSSSQNYLPTVDIPAYMENKPYPHIRIGLNGGYSYQVVNTDNTLEQHIQNYMQALKSGTHFWTDLTYFFTEQSGIGFSYYSANFNNSMDNVTLSNNGQVFATGTLSDDINMSFIGPMYSARELLWRKKQDALLVNVGIGYMGYSNNEKLVLYNYKIEGSTVGVSATIGYDHAISKDLALGIQFSFIKGNLMAYDQFDGTKSTHVDLDKTNMISMNHFDISIGLRFNTSR